MDHDTQTIGRPTSAWIAFGYLSFGISIAMVGGGILFLPLDWWVKGYFAMGVLLLVQSCFALAKNMRDIHEAGRFINRIETARTEKLLSGA
ncbi:YiaA/YiaB family inner membrane protein [Beijerinckia sp. L45]|uniref:YiaA/YiaB family inner membrane protein n=1 Tax=Beijerinckia sp. L45 TaxID=1641855 RepID=UPI00131C8B41|nr:YiaA/YiaB family inner membrane protein [Beijerinckia sp. L45]